MANSTNTFILKTQSLTYLLHEGKNNIGRDRSVCDIFVQDKKCGKIHASIILHQNKCHLQVEPRHSVLLNKRVIRVISDAAIVSIDIRDGDIIEIHDHIFQLKTYEATESDLDDTDME